MGWFKRMKEGITTSTKDKKEIREGLWYKCPQCDEVIDTDEFHKSLFVCQSCSYHERIGSHEYFDIFFDKMKERTTLLMLMLLAEETKKSNEP